MVVNEIQAETGVGGSTLSHHLEKLKNDELITAEREKAFIRAARTAKRLNAIAIPRGR
jgi:DNA-binding transcriptional ArsR family regulator